MTKKVPLQNGSVAEVHTGDYGCCPDCKARLEADDVKRAQAKGKSA